MSPSVILRADGSPKFGLGHVMRCIALAQGLQERGYAPVFIVKDYEGTAPDIIKRYGFEVISLRHTKGFLEEARDVIEIAGVHNVRTVIVDLNHAGTLADESGFEEFLTVLKDSGASIVMVDGFGGECISAHRLLPIDILVVPYAGAQRGRYKTQATMKLLLGADYFPFRKDFLQMVSMPKEIVKQVRRILVSMGGGDVGALNEKVVEAVLSLNLPDIELKVTGGIVSQRWQEKFRRSAGRYEFLPRSERMPELIQWADIAVISSGLTKYETALFGTPAIVLSFNAAQKAIMQDFEQTGCVRHLGEFNEVTPQSIARCLGQLMGDEQLRAQMSMKGQCLVDGKGVERVINQISLEVVP